MGVGAGAGAGVGACDARGDVVGVWQPMTPADSEKTIKTSSIQYVKCLLCNIAFTSYLSASFSEQSFDQRRHACFSG